MSIYSRTSADEVKLGLVDATVKHPWLWSWMEQCVTINNVKDVLPNHGLNHPVKYILRTISERYL